MASVIAEDRVGTSSSNRFVATIFLGSFLLFLVQPMIARMVLPRLGGAPAVWNSAMLVYQALLLAGYAYAHWLGRFRPRRQALIHFAAFAAAATTLPIGLIGLTPSATANPFLWVPALLFASIGPLFFVVSAQAPLMQRWYALTEGRDPYPLYAASNLGSFVGLLAYPLVVEPWLPLSAQRWLWTAAYALLVFAVGWCAMALPNQSVAVPVHAEAPAPSQAEVARWALLAAVPSGLILSTTLHLTTDIVAMPLLWVIPLGVYLLSFSFAFASRRGPARLVSGVAPFLLMASAAALFVRQPGFAPVFAALSVLTLFALAVALHSRLYDSRPPEQHLTAFYLAMSAGGVLGGLFCALLAPQIFNWTYEHPVLLFAAAALLGVRNPLPRVAALWADDALKPRLTRIGVTAVALFSVAALGLFGLQPSSSLIFCAVAALMCVSVAAIGNRILFASSVAALMLASGGWDQIALSAARGHMTRSFFGIYSIGEKNRARWLVHGTTVHGIENLGSPQREREPTAYYVRGSGVGRALTAVPRLFGNGARVDVVGLGAGTLACYAHSDQRWTFYEIDPAVARIASDPKKFRFLARCLPNARLLIGDARLTLGRMPPASADLLVVDAFSSDSIPMHLLTREAFDLYRRHLRPDGLLIVHITNRYLEIEPVIAAAAAEGGWSARLLSFSPSSAERADNAAPSTWVALSQSPVTIERLTANDGAGWQKLRGRSGFRAWTDDHASLLPLIRY
jgi:SAM-dependent methyltransferase